MKKALLIMIMIAFSLLIYSFKNNTSNSVQEQYIILKKIDNIEIRKYRESVNASYYSKGKEERNNYFKNLAAYIFGDNNKNISIAMTSPVTMKLYGNKEMIFRMPNNYTLDSLPTTAASQLVKKAMTINEINVINAQAQYSTLKGTLTILLETTCSIAN